MEDMLEYSDDSYYVVLVSKVIYLNVFGWKKSMFSASPHQYVVMIFPHCYGSFIISVEVPYIHQQSIISDNQITSRVFLSW